MLNVAPILGTLDQLIASALDPQHQADNPPYGVPDDQLPADPRALLTLRRDPLPGQQTVSTFLSLLADDLLQVIPETGGTGSELWLELHQSLPKVIGTLLVDLGGDNYGWEAGLRQMLGVPDLQNGGTPDLLRQRVFERISPRAFRDLLFELEAIPQTERNEWHGIDERFDYKRFLALAQAQLESMGQDPQLVAGAVSIAQTGVAQAMAVQVPAARMDATLVGSSPEIGNRVHEIIQADYVKASSGFVVTERSVFQNGNLRRIGTIGTLRNLLATVLPELEVLDMAVVTGMSSRLRPDIVDLSNRFVYEIKPRNDALFALAQVNGYCVLYEVFLTIMQAAGNVSLALLPLIPGPLLPQSAAGFDVPRVTPLGFMPRRHIPLTERLFAETVINPALPGVILYDVYEKNMRRERARQPARALSREETLALLAAIAAMLLLLGLLIGSGGSLAPVAGPAAASLIPLLVPL